MGPGEVQIRHWFAHWFLWPHSNNGLLYWEHGGSRWQNAGSDSRRLDRSWRQQSQWPRPTFWPRRLVSCEGSLSGYLWCICLVDAVGPPLLPGLAKRILAVPYPMMVMSRCWWLEGLGSRSNSCWLGHGFEPIHLRVKTHWHTEHDALVKLAPSVCTSWASCAPSTPSCSLLDNSQTYTPWLLHLPPTTGIQSHPPFFTVDPFVWLFGTQQFYPVVWQSFQNFSKPFCDHCPHSTSSLMAKGGLNILETFYLSIPNVSWQSSTCSIGQIRLVQMQ